jgi:hypothetical protein
MEAQAKKGVEENRRSGFVVGAGDFHLAEARC